MPSRPTATALLPGNEKPGREGHQRQGRRRGGTGGTLEDVADSVPATKKRQQGWAAPNSPIRQTDREIPSPVPRGDMETLSRVGWMGLAPRSRGGGGGMVGWGALREGQTHRRSSWTEPLVSPTDCLTITGTPSLSNVEAHPLPPPVSPGSQTTALGIDTGGGGCEGAGRGGSGRSRPGRGAACGGWGTEGKPTPVFFGNCGKT